MTPFVERYLAESYDDREAGLGSVRAGQLTGELGPPEDGRAIDGGLSAGRG